MRYFFHPESGSLFTTDGEYPGSDGLVEEISYQDYLTIKQEIEGSLNMLQDFDASGVAPKQGFSVHPPGMFDFGITHTYLKETTDKEGLMFVVEFTSPAGRIEKRFNIYNKSAPAMEIAQGELSALCHAVGQFRVSYPKNPDGSPIYDKAGFELRGKRGRMEVAPQTRKNADGKYEETGYMEVKKVYDAQGNEPGKAPVQQAQQTTQQPQQQAQPMQQNGSGGWGSPQAQPQQQAPVAEPAPGGWGGQNAANQQQPQAQPQQASQGTGEKPPKPPWMR